MDNKRSGTRKAFKRGDVIRRHLDSEDNICSSIPSLSSSSGTKEGIGYHYGICVGENKVIHFTTLGCKKCSLQEFSLDDKKFQVSKYE